MHVKSWGNLSKYEIRPWKRVETGQSQGFGEVGGMSRRSAGRPRRMATYVLLHGAGSDAWYWHRVAPLLRDLGHDVIAPDLPCDDDAAGIDDYARVAIDAIGDRAGVIVVAQSMAGFTATLVCEAVPVDLVVLVAAMTPRAGESAGEWWANTGHADAKREKAEQDG